MRYTLQPLLKWYLSKTRIYSFRNYKITIAAGVFHPGFFFSTRYLLSFLESKNLQNKSITEVGCGSGLISIILSKKNMVVAFDINQTAIETLKLNVKNNSIQNHQLTILESDLFNQIPAQFFDLLVVNPPYYTKDAQSMAEHAWFAGSHLQYFARLFSQAKNYMNEKSEMFMVLSDDCDISQILDISHKNGFNHALVSEKKFPGEINFIYRFKI